MIPVTAEIGIDESELEERFVRSPGPGGQNVNKVSTGVQLRFDAVHSSSLPDPVRQRLIRLAGRRIGTDGIITIAAHRFRTRERNRQDALQRLVDLIRRATHEPKARKKTKPTRASRERRLSAKRERAQTKRLRTRISSDE
jgi:ribosome-associated protein